MKIFAVTNLFYLHHLYLTFTFITFSIFISILPSVIGYSNNDIEIPKTIKDFKNQSGTMKNLFDNHTKNNYYQSDSIQIIQQRIGGKHHNKNFNSKKHNPIIHMLDKNKIVEHNNEIKKFKHSELQANKFDYYPIESVNLNYDPKEDENIRFVSITGKYNKKELSSKEKRFNIRLSKGNLKSYKEKNNRKKRNIQFLNSIKRNDYLTQSINSDDWIKDYISYDLSSAGIRFTKIAIPGLYYNAETPHKFRPSVESRLILETGPVWDRKPISNSVATLPELPGKSLLQNPQDTSFSNDGPSNCIWAIVNCCAKRDLTIRYGCFEQIGCVGAFWDFNPCGDSWQKKAVDEAERFFDNTDNDYSI